MSQLLELIVRARDEASATLDAIRGKSKIVMSDVAAASVGATIGIAGLATEIEAVRAAYTKIVQPAQEYILAVDELATKGQITREDAAKWTTLLTLLDIPLATVETAMRTMNENGISPTIGNLEEASEKFLAIEDPVERAQFAVDMFGARAGPAMAEILEKGRPAIEKLTTNVGLVIKPTEEATAAAKDLALAQAALDTAILEMTVATGTALMPWANMVIASMLVVLKPMDFVKWKIQELIDKWNAIMTLVGLGPPKVGSKGVTKPPKDKGEEGWGMALGGEVGTGGDAYMVGEHGAERFTPSVPGTISPTRDQLASSIDRMVKTLPTILIDAIERAK